MKRTLCILLILIFTLSILGTVSAEGFTDRGYYDYEGTMGQKTKILMSVFVEDGKVKGSYLYDKFRTEIKLDGVINGNQLIIKEYDTKNNVNGTFNGKFTTVDNITGMWVDKKSGKSTPFTLRLISALPFAEFGHRYAAIGIDNDKDVEKYVELLQSYIKKGDKAKIADMVSYPVAVTIKGKSVRIKNKQEFIKNYNSIFNPEFKSIMSNAYTRYMFANYQGLMFGSNLKNIWITGFTGKDNKVKLHIIAFNN